VVNPADVVKTRLQLLNKGASEVSYSGITDAFVKIFKQVKLKKFNCTYVHFIALAQIWPGRMRAHIISVFLKRRSFSITILDDENKF
jgi:hypothetical protein